MNDGMQRMAPLLDVSGVTLQYKTEHHLVTATYRVSFDVLPADRFVLLGPSGCGKSTLLKAVGGYMAPTEGTIKLKGADHPQARPRPGDGVPGVRPAAALEDGEEERDVRAAVFRQAQGQGGRGEGDGLHRQGQPHQVRRQLPAHAVGRHEAARRHRASDGHGAGHPADGRTVRGARCAHAARMQDELLQLWDDTRFTMLFVTHSIPEAVRVGNRILLLSPHPGQVKAELNSDRFRRSVDPATGHKLSERIHTMLFADEIEQTGAPQ